MERISQHTGIDLVTGRSIQVYFLSLHRSIPENVLTVHNRLEQFTMLSHKIRNLSDPAINPLHKGREIIRLVNSAGSQDIITGQAAQGLVFGQQLWGGGENGRFFASAIAFILNYACYFSEIYRGGIQGVPHGQQEAGLVLGLSRSQIFFKITLLQMIKRIVPPMSNEIITLVKDTSLARIIALQEVIWAGQAFMKGSQGISGAIWPLFFTGAYYLAFSGILTLLFGWIEKKLSYFKA